MLDTGISLEDGELYPAVSLVYGLSKVTAELKESRSASPNLQEDLSAQYEEDKSHEAQEDSDATIEDSEGQGIPLGKGMFKKSKDSQKRESVIIFVRPHLKGNQAMVENSMSSENDRGIIIILSL